MARSKSGGKPGGKPESQHGVSRPEGEHGVAWTPPKTFAFDPSQEEVRRIANALPGGLFGIVANENARYTVFTGNCLSLALPNRSRYAIYTGCYVVDSCNRLFDALGPEEDWVAIMGDDHQFPPWILLKLLGLMYENDLDIVVPLCFKRDFPPTPVLYRYKDQPASVAEKYAYDPTEGKALVPIDLNDFPEGGLIEVDGAGSAGMVVRRRVIDAMEPPWFRLGVGHWGEDLDFCRRAQDLGFKIHADLDMPLGQIVNTTLWPMRHINGHWMVEYDFGQQGGFQLAL